MCVYVFVPTPDGDRVYAFFIVQPHQHPAATISCCLQQQRSRVVYPFPHLNTPKRSRYLPDEARAGV